MKTIHNLPADYLQRVYAGVLGKTIGVYLGRPIEGWGREAIAQSFGPIKGYVHERLKKPLIVPDDDLSGTFTFIRALEDHADAGEGITSKQIGRTWLNYLIENKSVLWWGGMGLSTEHTAYLRLKSGIDAPTSGSMALNGRVVAEQIGAQIFIDGWAMVAPGRPEAAVRMATEAARVSHDGEAVHAANLIAAMESMAFVESDRLRLLDGAMRFIPADSLVRKLIDELRDHHAGNQTDWERAMAEVVETRWGYDKYGGNCHVMPNHAIIILALLYCDDSFDRALMIANSAGWDTDCNSGNIGCLMGIKNGIAGIDDKWREPVSDRLILPTAAGGECMSDCGAVAIRIANMGLKLAGRKELSPKDGAKLHFSLPGAVQGMVATGHVRMSPDDGRLRVECDGAGRVAVATLPSPKEFGSSGYGVQASPTVYPGQTITATAEASRENTAPVKVRLLAQATPEGGDTDFATPQEKEWFGPLHELNPGESQMMTWRVGETGGMPISGVGLDINGSPEAGSQVAWIDRIDWLGTPSIHFDPRTTPQTALRQFTCGATAISLARQEGVLRIVQNDGVGVMSLGTRDWVDYEMTATITPQLTTSFGLAVRYRGLRRYAALLLERDTEGRGVVRLVEMVDERRVLDVQPFEWELGTAKYEMRLAVKGNRLTGRVGNNKAMVGSLATSLLPTGGIGVVVDTGRVDVHEMAMEGK